MDPLSAVSGIAGLIAVSLKTIELVAQYVNSVHEHKAHAETLHQELLVMTQAMEQLQTLLEEQKRSGQIANIGDDDRNTVFGRAISQCKKIIEQVQDKLVEPVSKLRKAVAKLKWPFEQKELLRLVESLRRYSQLFQLSLTVTSCKILSQTFDLACQSLKEQRDNCEHIKKLSANFPQMAKPAEETLQQTETLLKLVPTFLEDMTSEMKEIGYAQRLAEQREQERRTTDILDWLCPLSALQKHSNVKARRAGGTGGWFLRKHEMSNWLSTNSLISEVLCLGDPGVGKTNLASLVVDALLDLYKEADVAIVHLYCDYREQQAQTVQHCARSILRQLSMQMNSNAVPVAVSDFYQRTRNEVKDQSWYLELQRIILRVASTFSAVFLVFDALDEAEPTSTMPELLELLGTLRGHLGPRNPKIFATSRKHISTVQDFFETATKVNIVANDHDIRAILSKTMADHHNAKYVLDEELKQVILGQLCASARGMFLLPILQIQNVMSQLTKSEIRRALRELSSSLTEVFQSTIGRILSAPDDLHHVMNRRNLAIKALMWISHAKRVLTVRELQHALAIRLDDLELDRENFVQPELVVDSCFGLVEIDNETSTIRFVHYSLQEYLRTHHHGLFDDGDMEIARTCLRYLTLDTVKGLHCKNRATFIQALEDLPFLNYAATEWGYHAHAMDAPLDDLRELALALLKSSPHLLTAARVRDHKSPYFRKWYERMYAWAYSDGDGAGISVCSSFGLTDLVKLLLNQNRQPVLDAKNMYGSTPLHEAAMRGYAETVQLLLTYGASVLALNAGNSTPLFLAVGNAQVSSARVLLQEQTSSQLQTAGREGWTVLHKATDIGQEEMVVLLLQKGALANDEDSKGMRPLHLAARKGYHEVARLLLVSEAEIHAEDSYGCTPLDYAVTSGSLEVAKMLLDNGADVEHRSGDRWTVLKRAARRGSEQLLTMLLERGADVMAEDRSAEIPLHAAARSGNKRVVELLLYHKPHLKKQQLSKMERKGSTARDVAFFTSHFNIYKTLRAAELDEQPPPVTVLQKLAFAIEMGKRDKIRRLLADGAFDIDTFIDGRQPALHLAMQEEQPDIAKLLLAHGADVNSTGYHNWTPLHIVTSIGNISLTQICLDHGANVHARTETAQTPLHKACASGSLQVMTTILKAGADKEAMNNLGMRPLHVAAHQNISSDNVNTSKNNIANNGLAMVRCLVQEYHVDTTATDEKGYTAAIWAERRGHLDVLYYLKGQEKALKLRKANHDSNTDANANANIHGDGDGTNNDGD